ncbi:MAG: NUDIX domain-containing protein [bacterium]|nr:NUDIX domain-containing protein [bacterium]
MQEYLDVLDDKGIKTGQTVSYDKAHKKGTTHRSIHVWFINSRNQLLLQKRSTHKKAYPNHWDISASGHVSAGQTSLEAAKAETEEELGLTPPDEAFEYLFSIEEHIVLNNGTYVNNEFQDVYLVRSDIELSQLRLQTSDVSDARWIDIEEFKLWIKGEGEKLVPHEEEFGLLLAHLG